MSNFFDNFLNRDIRLNELEPISEKLENWGKKFWAIDSEEIAGIFARQGYEDKGYGHIVRIISNVRELLINYYEVLCRLNFFTKENAKKRFKKRFIEVLRPNLIMFYIVAHLHDIGMSFAGIFKALSDLVAVGSDKALHISEIIHNYHQYASFIVLLEINHLVKGKPKSEAQCPYLFNINKNVNKKNNLLKSLNELKENLSEIYNNYSKKYLKHNIKNGKEFLVILAILCLLHKEVNYDYVQSILRKFKHKNHQDTIKYFNKWWSFLSRAKEWTEKIQKKIQESQELKKRYSESEQFVLKSQMGKKKNAILDLLLVEALLQYGDKTDITIERLARIPEGSKKSNSGGYIPLYNFSEDTQYDNQRGFICTEIAQKIISPFARFRACRFIPVILVDIQNYEINGQEKLEIVIHYIRFEQDEDVFRLLRYHNEKDFFDLGFLDVINIHIPMLIYYSQSPESQSDTTDNYKEPSKNITFPIFEIVFKKIEHSFKELDEKYINQKFTNLAGSIKTAISLIKNRIAEESARNINPTDRFPYTTQNREAIYRFSRSTLDPEEKKKTEGIKKVFYETCDLIIPSSFETMAILNLFYEEN